MGLRLKKTAPSLPARPTRLQRLSDDDLYLLLESSVIEAQRWTVEMRKTPDQAAAVAWLRSALEQASMAAEEIDGRI